MILDWLLSRLFHVFCYLEMLWSEILEYFSAQITFVARAFHLRAPCASYKLLSMIITQMDDVAFH